MRRAFSILFFATVVLPPAACGHGVEFLSARLTLLPQAEVLLEVTADYGSNPMLIDEAAACAALADPIRLRRNDVLVPLSDMATATVSPQHDWAEFAPASYLPPDTEGQTHQLLTAAWRWRSETPEITFEMPKGKLHDVLLWTRDETNPDAPARWMLLLGGDRSKAIAVAWPPWWQRGATVIASCLILVGLLAIGYFVSRNFTLRQRTL